MAIPEELIELQKTNSEEKASAPTEKINQQLTEDIQNMLKTWNTVSTYVRKHHHQTILKLYK